MKKTITLLIFFCISALNIAAAQSEQKEDKTLFVHVAPQEIATIQIKIGGYDMNTVGALKDELLGYEGKVLKILIDEKHQNMDIIYNGHMIKEDMHNAFLRHEISFNKLSTTSTSSSGLPDKK